MPCQREGCGALVHHLCQGAWERQKGYGDTVARLCCVHHPDYKYVGTPLKVGVAVANEELEEASKADGSDDSHDDPSCVDSISGEGMGVGVNDDDTATKNNLLPLYEITDYTADSYDIHKRTAHFM